MDVTTTDPLSFVAVTLFAALHGLAGAASPASPARAAPVAAAPAAADHPDGPPRHGPPPAAFTACEGKSAGDACTVPHGDRSATGVCAGPPPGVSDTRLACRPDGPPPDGPPPARASR